MSITIHHPSARRNLCASAPLRESPAAAPAECVRIATQSGLVCMLYRGDWEKVWPVRPVDALITDPPYGREMDKKRAHSFVRDSEEWAASDWDAQRPATETLRRLPGLAPLAAIWGGNYFADCLPPTAGWLVWRKPEAETGFSLADAELCWTSADFAARMKTMPRSGNYANRQDVPENDHPTQKPVIAMAWPMEALRVPEGATVLDPYMGTGTTGIACLRTGRHFIGVERDPRYFETAVRRITEEAAGLLL